MTLDLLDRAFVNRLRAVDVSAATAIVPSPPTTTTTSTAVPNHSRQSAPQSATAAASLAADATDVVDRLLDAAPTEWNAVADAVERAIADFDGSQAAAGRAGFVVAVVSRRPKDGCSTFVDGLARTLRARGMEAVATTFDRIDADRESVQIVDAGSWFGSGPIRRERATTLARDCDAAILLRRADRSTAAAFARALAVAGVRVLGEVTTFGREQSATREATA